MNIKRFARLLKFVFFLLMLTGFGMSLTAQDDSPASPLVTSLDPAFATDWMDLLYRRVEAERVSAPAASRVYGYASVTLYESLLGGMPFNVTLAGQIWHMPDLPLWDGDKVYDWITVMDSAMATVLPTLFVEPSEETLDAFAELRASHGEQRAAEIDEEILAHSRTYGELLGEGIIAWIEEDGFKDTRNAEYELPEAAGLYTITTPGTKPQEPYWGDLRPFVLESGYQCGVYPDIEQSIDKDSTFYKQAMEVAETGRNLTDWQTETARFWVDTPGQTGTPAGHWIAISTQLVDQYELNLQTTSMMYAMVGMAVADAFISCWRMKYDILLPRPVTYIQENIRQRWTPYIESPPFPEYPSGHSVVSAAAAEVLTDFFGARAFEDKTHIIYGHERLIRSYTSFEAAAYEAAISRLYGGIHYRSAIENGMRQGRCIGNFINNNIRLSPVLQGE